MKVSLRLAFDRAMGGFSNEMHHNESNQIVSNYPSKGGEAGPEYVNITHADQLTLAAES